MKFRKTSAFAAAASLAVAPVALQAASDAPSMDRAAAPVEGESELTGGIGPALIIVAIAAVGMGALLIAEDDDDDQPVSA